MTFGVVIASLCLAWLAIASLVRLTAGRKVKGQLAGPCCGGCGYSAIGLTRMICPECGRDLRQVGLEFPSAKRHWAWSLAGSIISLTLAIDFSAVGTITLFRELLPQMQVRSFTADFSGPWSKAYQLITVTGSRTWYTSPSSVLPMMIHLKLLSGTSIPLRIGSPDSFGPSSGEMLQPLGDFDIDAILKWMAKNGVATSNESVTEEVRAVAIAAREGVWVLPLERNVNQSWSSSTNDPHFLQSRFGRSDSSLPIPWITEMLTTAWAILWAIGIWYILWPRRNAVAVLER